MDITSLFLPLTESTMIWTNVILRLPNPRPLFSHRSHGSRQKSLRRRLKSASRQDSETSSVKQTELIESKPVNGLDLSFLPEEFIESGEVFPHRWILTLAMSLAFVLCNMDKVNMSVAVIPMASDLGWSATSRGIVQSSFFWGYTLTQVPAGWLSTKIGGAKVLLGGVLLWSLGTFLAPAAAHVGFYTLCISRVAVIFFIFC